MMIRLRKISFVIVVSTLLLVSRVAFANEPVIQYEGDVVVGSDGNGVTAAQFPTTVDGKQIRGYVLVVENGCKLDAPKCKFPLVSGLTITLNDDIVFEGASPATRETLEVALNPVGTEQNSIVLAANGESGSRARVHIAAIDQSIHRTEGLSVLPAADLQTFIVVHNAGPAPLAYRIVFYLPDGTEAGRTSAQRIESNGSELRALNVAAQGINWNAGAVHILWGTLGTTIVSASATYSVEINGQTISNVRGLNLTDVGTFPVNKARFDEDTAGLLE
jgi:hypothetical protein